MNKRATSAHASPRGRPGKKRKSSSMTGSQTAASPAKMNPPILDPSTLPWPKKVDIFGQMPELCQEAAPQKHSKSSDEGRMELQVLIDDSTDIEQICDDPELPQLPLSQIEDRVEHGLPTRQELPTSELTHVSTEYQTSEMELFSDAPEAPLSPRATVKTLINMVKEMTPDTLNENKNELIKRLNGLRTYDSTSLRATLEPDMVDTLKDRLRAMESALKSTVLKIPETRWLVYRKQLIHMVEDKPVARMDFEQRLWAVMDVVYLSEELEALETGNWERLEAAIRITAAMAEVTGPEHEEVPDRVEMWVGSKFKDIAWLKKIAVIRERHTDEVDVDIAMEE